MIGRTALYVLCTLFVLPIVSCTITLKPEGAATAPVVNDLRFRVTATEGLAQVRDSSVEPWRFLKSGDVLEPDCLVRTGFNSAADLVMLDNDREVAIRLGSLLPEMKLHHAYDTLLAPKAYKKCVQSWVEKKGDCSDFLPLNVCRTALVPVNSSDFLEVVSLFLSMEDIMSGRSAAGSGRACPT